MGESAELLGRLLPSLALIVGALLVVRRWAQRGTRGTGEEIRVRARAGLTRGAMVAVIEIGDQRYLVGASEHGVSLLGELGADALPTYVPEEAATDAPPPTPDRPRMGPIDRLRDMTVRTHLERPIRAPGG